MWRLAAAVCVLTLCSVTLPCDAAFGHMKPAEHFSDEVAKHFLKSSKMSYAKRVAAKKGRPLMVLLTKKGCGACQNLKQSVNRGAELAPLLSQLVVVHAENDAATEWQQPGNAYAPQTYFFAPGEDEPLPILGTSETSPHFFHDETTLVWGAKKAIEVVATGERMNKKGERTDL